MFSFRPCFINICHGRALGSGRTGQFGELQGRKGRTRTPARPRVVGRGQRIEHRCVAWGKSPWDEPLSLSPESTPRKCRSLQAKKGHTVLCPVCLDQKGSGEGPGWESGGLDFSPALPGSAGPWTSHPP